jgi:hypothetical protein
MLVLTHVPRLVVESGAGHTHIEMLGLRGAGYGLFVWNWLGGLLKQKAER